MSKLDNFSSRHISSFSALGFLAVWHGFAAGYFVSFFMEFIGVDGEKSFIEALTPLNETLSKSVLKVRKTVLYVTSSIRLFWYVGCLEPLCFIMDLFHLN